MWSLKETTPLMPEKSLERLTRLVLWHSTFIITSLTCKFLDMVITVEGSRIPKAVCQVWWQSVKAPPKYSGKHILKGVAFKRLTLVLTLLRVHDVHVLHCYGTKGETNTPRLSLVKIACGVLEIKVQVFAIRPPARLTEGQRTIALDHETWSRRFKNGILKNEGSHVIHLTDLNGTPVAVKSLFVQVAHKHFRRNVKKRVSRRVCSSRVLYVTFRLDDRYDAQTSYHQKYHIR